MGEKSILIYYDVSIFPLNCKDYHALATPYPSPAPLKLEEDFNSEGMGPEGDLRLFWTLSHPCIPCEVREGANKSFLICVLILFDASWQRNAT